MFERAALALAGSLLWTGCSWAAASLWIRPSSPDEALVWGRRDGIVFGLPSPGGMRGPRGLIRVGIPVASSENFGLINFIAIEPVTAGRGSRGSRMAFSELEPSVFDAGKHGKRLWVEGSEELTVLPAKPRPVERLRVRIEVEPYTANHAHVYLLASMYSDRPEELELGVYAHPDSAPIEELTVTATMGNYERLRRLWLKDRVVESRALYGSRPTDGWGFMDLENYTLDEILRGADGDVLAICTTDEEDPAGEANSGAPQPWRYRYTKLTQYWRVPARHIQPDLRIKVNGRRVYWGSQNPIPGGAAFENFEVRQRFVPGQVFLFGLTRREPREFKPPLPRLLRPGDSQ